MSETKNIVIDELNQLNMLTSEQVANWLNHTRETASDGIYILTTDGRCIPPQFYGVVQGSVTPEGVAVLQGEHRLVVALTGSDKGLVLFDGKSGNITENAYDSLEEASFDWAGMENTQRLLKKGSPAAKFCADYESENRKKGAWWIPSLGEMNLMYQNKPLIDACLTLCGGAILPGLYHWTSSEFSRSSGWVLNWNYGYTSLCHRYLAMRVRPVSAFL